MTQVPMQPDPELITHRHLDKAGMHRVEQAKAGAQAELDGGSIVAAGGWCAPTEVLYPDLLMPAEGEMTAEELEAWRKLNDDDLPMPCGECGRSCGC